MKVIDFKQVKDAAENMNPTTWLGWVDYALRHKTDFLMPPKPRMSQSDGDYYNIMPALYDKDNLASVKMIGRHSIKRNEQRSVMMSDILLYEADTGILKALIDGEYITTLRTGVVAAHSALLFAKKDFETISLLGLGNIMTVCFKTFIAKLREDGDDRKLTIKLLRHHNQEDRFFNKFKDEPNLTFEFCNNYDTLFDGADIIISAVTKATENFSTDQFFKAGVTVVPICTMGFQNCDLFFEKIFTDEIEQIRGFKYFNNFKSVVNVSDVLNGIVPGRESESERILVYDYGLGIHDLYFASKFYELIAGQNIEYRYCKEKYFR